MPDLTPMEPVLLAVNGTLMRGLELNPNLASAYRNRAAAHHALGDATKAREDYAASVRLEPASADQVPTTYRPAEVLSATTSAIVNL